ncbi:MAG: tRNA (5-methylaminomethyl-2-thiouridylate)-methyltransferase, partial [Candidatus Thiodiazotropha endolucinida]
LDCKVFMVHKAYEWIKAKDFDFIITGEVIGQRPMSQRKETMPIVSYESGAHDLLLRPLCAKNLPMTLPEREGWVDRNRLYGFSGRSRKPQMALAAQFGIEDYAQPAGGCCFLTDKQYAVKLKDLWNARGSKQYELDDIMLLKVGRHLRPSSRFKVIIAREEGEANFLQGYRKRYPHINTVSHGGPLALIDGEINERDIELIGRVVARYSQGRNAVEVELRFTDLSGDSRSLKVVPMPAHEVPKEWLI